MRFIAVFMLLFSTKLIALEIYKCVHVDGRVLFKDTPCKNSDLDVGTKYLETPINLQDMRHIQRKFKHYTEYAVKERQRLLKQQIRAQKKEELELKRHLRLQERCETVRRQIAGVEQRFKSGYTAKQRESLERKLAEYKFKKQKYCK